MSSGSREITIEEWGARKVLHEVANEHWWKYDPTGPDETWQCRLCLETKTERGPGY